MLFGGLKNRSPPACCVINEENLNFLRCGDHQLAAVQSISLVL